MENKNNKQNKIIKDSFFHKQEQIKNKQKKNDQENTKERLEKNLNKYNLLNINKKIKEIKQFFNLKQADLLHLFLMITDLSKIDFYLETGRIFDLFEITLLTNKKIKTFIKNYDNYDVIDNEFRKDIISNESLDLDLRELFKVIKDQINIKEANKLLISFSLKKTKDKAETKDKTEVLNIEVLSLNKNADLTKLFIENMVNKTQENQKALIVIKKEEIKPKDIFKYNS